MITKKRITNIEEPTSHKIAEKITEILIYFIVIFSPWAFGTTQQWSIWIINIANYLLGFLIIAKWAIRIVNKYLK